MSKKQQRMPQTADGKRISLSGQVNGGNGHYSPSGLLSGYIAQGAVPGLIYALTMNGYMVLCPEIKRREMRCLKIGRNH